MNPPPSDSDTPEPNAALVAAYESAAKNLAASVFQMTLPTDSEYVLRDAGYFRNCDLAFYQRVTTELRVCGLGQIIDVESQAHTRSFGKAVLLRYMLSADEPFTAGIFSLRPKPPGVIVRWLSRLFGKKMTPQHGSISFETEFSNGEFVSTDNALGRNPFCQPPEMYVLQMPADTTPRDLLEEHRRRVGEYKNSHPGASVVQVSDLNDIAMRDGRHKVLKARYRRAIGGITREELQGLAKEKSPHMEKTVMEEMRRLLAGQESGPEWAGFFKSGDYQKFIDIVRADYARRGLQVTIHEGVARVEGARIEQGLQNLAQVCHQSGDVNLWAGLVSDHFSKLARLVEPSGGTAMNPKDFAAAAPSLAVKLYPDDYADGMSDDPPVIRVDLEGTLSVLVLDLAEGLRMVNRSMIAGWGKTDAELFEHGLQWLQRDTDIEIGDFELAPGIFIKLVASDGFYAASRALILDQHPGFVGTHGSLIGVPHRHALISYPIENRDLLRAIEALAPMLGGLYKEGPGSISPEMYWYREGRFTQLPFRSDGNKMVFDPPADFAALLAKLK